MSTTLRLHVRVDPQRTTLVFHQFPVHIGRDRTSDCPLAFEFVSRRHAHVEIEDGVVYLCDDGSTCGTFVRGGAERLPRHGRVKLADVGWEFQIGHAVGATVTIRAELCETDPAFEDTLDGALTIPLDTGETQPYAAEKLDPEDLDASAVRKQLQTAFETHRHGFFETRHALLQALGNSDGSRARPLLIALFKECPWLTEDREVRDTARALGVELARAEAPTPETDAALSRLRDLAAAHIPFAPRLDSAEAIVRFTTRLDLVLRIVFDGVDALRVAYQYETDPAAEDAHNRFDMACALDWSRSDSHARGPLERIFTGLLAHRAQLTKEVAECFSRLAPEAIEATVRHPVAPFRYRAIWSRYRDEYRALFGSLGAIDAPRDSGAHATSGERAVAALPEQMPEASLA